MTDQTSLVTGAAGFIGFHVARQLLGEGRSVVGLDNLNDYYDPALKRARLGLLATDSRFSFVEADLADRETMAALFARHRFAKIVHLAAQAGVRYADEAAAANAPSKVYNVGNHHPEELMHVVGLLEQELGRTAIKELLPMQPGDVLETFADVEDLMRDTGFAPSTPIALGVRNLVTWYRDYFKV